MGTFFPARRKYVTEHEMVIGWIAVNKLLVFAKCCCSYKFSRLSNNNVDENGSSVINPSLVRSHG